MHTPTEGEMTVRYPVGCVVVDSIREVCYEVQADGALKYTPFLNTLTGKVIQPPTDPTSSPAPSEK